MNMVATMPMTVEEARTATDLIRSGLVELRQLLLEVYERDGWRALGYLNFVEYMRVEFDYGKSRAYQLISAAEVERNLRHSTFVERRALSEGVLRPLSLLSAEQQPVVFQRAVDTAPNGRVTAAHVQEIANEFRAPAPVTFETDGSGDTIQEFPIRDDEELQVVKPPHVAHNSGNNEWYTPLPYIEAARRVMGGIDLDPASSALANTVVGAERYFTADDNGLQQAWHGCVWMNPPYASELIGLFADKLTRHFRIGDVSEAIVLVNNATETAWFATLVDCASAVVFPRGRVRFWQPNGEQGAPLQGQAVLYFGLNASGFLDQFQAFGWGASL